MSNFSSSSAHALVVFRKAERSIRSREGEVIARYGLTPAQFGVLEPLYSLGGMNIASLMEKNLATPGNMTVIVRNLVRDGLISKKPDPSDGRSSIITLTEKGRTLMDKLMPEHLQNIENIFSVLTEDDREELIQILRKFRNLNL